METRRSCFSLFNLLYSTHPGPLQHKMIGNSDYIKTEFPKTDAFGTCTVERLDEMALMAERRKLGEETDAARKEVIAHLLEGEREQSTVRLLGLSAVTVLAALLLVVAVVSKTGGSGNDKSINSKKAAVKKDSKVQNNKKKDDGDDDDNDDDEKKDSGSPKKVSFANSKQGLKTKES
jgi:hypothetical protein